MNWLKHPNAIPLLIGGAICFVFAGLVAFLFRVDRSAPTLTKDSPPEEPEAHEGERPKTKPGRDQRTLPRRRGKIIEVLIATPESKHDPIRGLVLDRSMNGLGLETDREIPVGTIISILPAEANEMVPWVDVQVRNCRISGSNWDVGCQFVGSPPFSTMLLFG